MKNFSVTDRLKAQFRMDMFNLFNHPVLGFNTTRAGRGLASTAAATET